MIKFQCHHCQKALSSPDHKAGASARCPACKQPLVVPALAAAEAVSIDQWAETPSAPSSGSVKLYLMWGGVGIVLCGIAVAVVAHFAFPKKSSEAVVAGAEEKVTSGKKENATPNKKESPKKELPLQVLSEDYLPFKSGALARYDIVMDFPNGTGMGRRVQMLFGKNGLGTETLDRTYGLDEKGKEIAEQFYDERKPTRYNKENGCVWISKLNDEPTSPYKGTYQTWGGMLKIGAKVGDTWEERSPTKGIYTLYTLVRFGEASVKFDGSTRPCVVIRGDLVFHKPGTDRPEPVTTYTEDTYVKNLGLKQRLVYSFGKPSGKWELDDHASSAATDSETAFFTKGQPAPPVTPTRDPDPKKEPEKPKPRRISAKCAGRNYPYHRQGCSVVLPVKAWRENQSDLGVEEFVQSNCLESRNGNRRQGRVC